MTRPILQTERLVFHPFTIEDVDLLAELHSDPQVQQYMGGAMSPEALRAMLDGFIREQALRGHTKWKVSLHDGAFVGRCGVAHWPPTGDLELGYGLKPEFRGRGLATEAAAAVAGWMFGNTDASHIIAFTRPGNWSSRRVLERIGMAYQGDHDIGATTVSALYRMDRPI